MTNAKEQTIASYNMYATDYADRYKSIKYTKKYLDYFINNAKGNTILDLGCGPGRDSLYFSDQGFEVTGIDASSSMIAIAKNNFSNCKFEVKEFTKLDFDENSFDNLWASASLLHLPKIELESVLTNLRKILKPGGLFYISMQEGNGETIQNISVVKSDRLFTRYSEINLKKSLANSGFTIELFEKDENQRVVTWLVFFLR